MTNTTEPPVPEWARRALWYRRVHARGRWRKWDSDAREAARAAWIERMRVPAPAPAPDAAPRLAKAPKGHFKL